LLLAACQTDSGQVAPPRTESVADEVPADEAAKAEPASADNTEAPAADMNGLSSNEEWQAEIEERDGVKIAKVPSGCFMMGAEGVERAQPVHQVCLTEPYWIDVTEVSNAQFELFGGEAERESTFPGQAIGEAEQPRTNVSWEEASAFCQLRGAHLPTEAEWEYASRGPEGWGYPWGDHFDPTRLNFCGAGCPITAAEDGPYFSADDGYALAAPVDSLPEGTSWVGALHMAGNVAEWVADYYGPAYYANSPVEDPLGPESGQIRAVKSIPWSWFIDPEAHSHMANRWNFVPDGGPKAYSGTTGFRCVQPAS